MFSELRNPWSGERTEEESEKQQTEITYNTNTKIFIINKKKTTEKNKKKKEQDKHKTNKNNKNNKKNKKNKTKTERKSNTIILRRN